MKNFSGIKLSLLFSIMVFIIQSISLSTVPIFWFTAVQLGIFEDTGPFPPTYSIIVTSIIVGIILARIIGKRVFKPITDINEATKKLATGEFDVKINESHVLGKEIREMIHSFNVMTNELKNIETFRNDFVTNVSHEFKTPISAIEGYATLLQDDTLSTEERNSYIERILSSSRRLSTLSGNILMISRLEHQEIIPDKTYYNLDEQIRNCILSLENLWNEKNISLDIDLDNIKFYGNKGMLSHVWYNIISNAIKFTPNGGVVSVKMNEANNIISVKITDTGIGMNEETLKHIFDKFYCGDKSRYDSGNGLGLTLAKRIIDLCKGTVSVKSELNYGTEFIITLPNTVPNI